MLVADLHLQLVFPEWLVSILPAAKAPKGLCMGHDPLQNSQVPILGSVAGIVMKRAAVPQQILCHMEMSTTQSCRKGGPDDDFQIPAASADPSSDLA